MRDLRPFFWIALAVFVWGLALAVGVWLFAERDKYQWLRPLVIVLVVDVFLALWLLALVIRRKR